MVLFAGLARHLESLFHDFLLPEDDGLAVDGFRNAFFGLVNDLLVAGALGDELDGFFVETLGFGVIAVLHFLARTLQTGLAVFFKGLLADALKSRDFIDESRVVIGIPTLGGGSGRLPLGGFGRRLGRSGFGRFGGGHLRRHLGNLGNLGLVFLGRCHGGRFILLFFNNFRLFFVFGGSQQVGELRIGLGGGGSRFSRLFLGFGFGVRRAKQCIDVFRLPFRGGGGFLGFLGGGGLSHGFLRLGLFSSDLFLGLGLFGGGGEQVVHGIGLLGGGGRGLGGLLYSLFGLLSNFGDLFLGLGLFGHGGEQIVHGIGLLGGGGRGLGGLLYSLFGLLRNFGDLFLGLGLFGHGSEQVIDCGGGGFSSLLYGRFGLLSSLRHDFLGLLRYSGRGSGGFIDLLGGFRHGFPSLLSGSCDSFFRFLRGRSGLRLLFGSAKIRPEVIVIGFSIGGLVIRGVTDCKFDAEILAEAVKVSGKSLLGQHGRAGGKYCK